MRCALLSCLTACGFQSSAATPLELDATAPDSTPCQVGAGSPIGTDRGKVGLSDGGGNVRPLACAGDAQIIGLALDMSNQPANGQGTESARGIRIGCATVAFAASKAHTGPIMMKDIDGNGGSGWSPSTMTALALCPPGAVVSGLMVHGGVSGNLFLDATMTCTAFDTNAQLTATTAVPIVGSQTETQRPSQALCDAGEHVVSMTTDTGAGLDSLQLLCAPTICK